MIEPTPTPRPFGKPWRFAEAAAFLDIAERTFYRWQKSGRIRPIKISGKIYLPDELVRRIASEGDAFLDSTLESNLNETPLKIA